MSYENFIWPAGNTVASLSGRHIVDDEGVAYNDAAPELSGMKRASMGGLYGLQAYNMTDIKIGDASDDVDGVKGGFAVEALRNTATLQDHVHNGVPFSICAKVTNKSARKSDAAATPFVCMRVEAGWELALAAGMMAEKPKDMDVATNQGPGRVVAESRVTGASINYRTIRNIASVSAMGRTGFGVANAIKSLSMKKALDGGKDGTSYQIVKGRQSFWSGLGHTLESAAGDVIGMIGAPEADAVSLAASLGGDLFGHGASMTSASSPTMHPAMQLLPPHADTVAQSLRFRTAAQQGMKMLNYAGPPTMMPYRTVGGLRAQQPVPLGANATHHMQTGMRVLANKLMDSPKYVTPGVQEGYPLSGGEMGTYFGGTPHMEAPYNQNVGVNAYNSGQSIERGYSGGGADFSGSNPEAGEDF
jgi:hypothetical protein